MDRMIESAWLEKAAFVMAEKVTWYRFPICCESKLLDLLLFFIPNLCHLCSKNPHLIVYLPGFVSGRGEE